VLRILAWQNPRRVMATNADKIAVLTGGAGKMGGGICRALEKVGITSAVLDLDVSRAENAAKALVVDVTDDAACAGAIEEIVKDLGGVDVLVNLAQAYETTTPVIELTADQLRRSYETGPIASLRMMQLCYPHMKARGGGAVINIVSGAGTQGTPNQAAYGSAKEAIRGITKAAALEWAKDNIRVNALAPFGGPPENLEKTPFLKQFVETTPLGRYGDPETEIGHGIAFLATNTFITGRTLMLDGGIGTFR
jgi:NAD(P)-dependent dehydrogenase (short-subunit alcohol dehydrogenase family)